MATTKVFPRNGSMGAIGAQAIIVIGGLLAVALMPPARGEMLLIPLTARAATQLPMLALRNGTRLIVRGRLSGSLVVRGKRSELGWPMLIRGVLPVASARAGCGSTVA